MNQETQQDGRPGAARTRNARAHRWGRWLGRIFVALLVLVAAILGGAWYLLRGSLPQLDGRARLAGLSAAVTVERDVHGVPTLRAAHRVDAARALGFVHAQERFFQMDLLRRRGAGELAALFRSRPARCR